MCTLKSPAHVTREETPGTLMQGRMEPALTLGPSRQLHDVGRVVNPLFHMKELMPREGFCPPQGHTTTVTMTTGMSCPV